MIMLGPYDQHLDPPEEPVYYEPCPDCDGEGVVPQFYDGETHDNENCDNCDGKGEYKIEP